jgi:hypothetical protein
MKSNNENLGLDKLTRARLVYNKETLEILGHFAEWRKQNPNEYVMTQSKFGTVEIGLVFHRLDIETLKKLGLYKIHLEMIERDLKDKKRRMDLARPKAEALLDEAEARLNGLCNDLGVNVSYSMSGDTHGIYEDYQYISVDVDGFTFERRI